MLDASALSRVLSSPALELDALVAGAKVGVLWRDTSSSGDRYVFEYDPCTQKNMMVSLSMPVRSEPWICLGKPHPFFEQNIPEGVMWQAAIERFGKALMNSQMALLAVADG